MTRFIKQKRCPTCGGSQFTRRHRAFWMRFFRASQLFVCRQCRTQVLLLDRPARPDTDLASD